MSRYAQLLAGFLAYLLFLATFLYLIGFVGDLVVPQSVDRGPAMMPEAAIVIDALLIALFAVQHSVMARSGFKRRWTRIVPASIERSIYVLAASIALILWTASFLAEIWRGCVEAIPKGQWEASASLGMGRLQQMRHVILPQALRIAVPPTVGFSVQVVKGTSLTSIIGFTELAKAGQVIANATFAPFTVYGFVALIYFVLCFPLSKSSQFLERKLNVAHRNH